MHHYSIHFHLKIKRKRTGKIDSLSSIFSAKFCLQISVICIEELGEMKEKYMVAYKVIAIWLTSNEKNGNDGSDEVSVKLDEAEASPSAIFPRRK